MRGFLVPVLVGTILLLLGSNISVGPFNIVPRASATHDPVDFDIFANTFGFNNSRPSGRNPVIIEYNGIIFTAMAIFDEAFLNQHNYAVYPPGTPPDISIVFPGSPNAIVRSDTVTPTKKTSMVSWTPTANQVFRYFCEFHPTTMLGDVKVFKNPDFNGNNKVDIVDFARVAKAYGSTPTSSNWDPLADLDSNNRVDIIDIAIIARVFDKILAD